MALEVIAIWFREIYRRIREIPYQKKKNKREAWTFVLVPVKRKEKREAVEVFVLKATMQKMDSSESFRRKLICLAKQSAKAYFEGADFGGFSSARALLSLIQEAIFFFASFFG